MNEEFEALDDEAKKAIVRIVERCMTDHRARTEVLSDGRDIYCCRRPDGGVSWDINGGKFGLNQARGIFRSVDGR